MNFIKWMLLREVDYKLWHECYYGGSFNPIHYDHISNATAAQNQLGIRVSLVPAYNPTHKEGLAPFQDRVNMCKLVAEKYRFKVVTIEEAVSKLHPKGKTPTASTIKALVPNINELSVKIPFLVGSDSVETLHTWVDPEFLVDKVVWVVSQRGGGMIKNPNFPNMNIIQIQAPNRNISSTKVRNAVRQGNWDAVKNLVTPEVANYIRQNNLYMNK